MDEENTSAQNQVVDAPAEETAASEESTTQETTQPSEDTVGDQTEEDNGNSGSEGSNGSDEVATDERQRPSRAERRIRDVVSQLKEKENQLKAYQSQYGQLPQDLRFPNYQGRDEVTPQELQSDVLSSADQLVQLRLREADMQRQQREEMSSYVTSIDHDSVQIAKEYPMLDDTNKDTYNPELANAIFGTFDQLVQAGNRVNLKTHVDQYMKPLLKLQKQREASVGVDIAEQRQKGAIRPNGTASNDVDIDKMSAAELESYIARQNRR